MTLSPRLRTIRPVYEKYLKILCDPTEDTPDIDLDSKDRERPLNDYQMFVKRSSAKRKYRVLSPRSRIAAIARTWRARRQNSKVGNKDEGDYDSNSKDYDKNQRPG